MPRSAPEDCSAGRLRGRRWQRRIMHCQGRVRRLGRARGSRAPTRGVGGEGVAHRILAVGSQHDPVRRTRIEMSSSMSSQRIAAPSQRNLHAARCVGEAFSRRGKRSKGKDSSPPLDRTNTTRPLRNRTPVAVGRWGKGVSSVTTGASTGIFTALPSPLRIVLGLRWLSSAGLGLFFSPRAFDFCPAVPGDSHRTSRVVCGHTPTHDHHGEAVHPHLHLAVPVFHVDVHAFRQVGAVEEEPEPTLVEHRPVRGAHLLVRANGSPTAVYRGNRGALPTTGFAVRG